MSEMANDGLPICDNKGNNNHKNRKFEDQSQCRDLEDV